MSWGGRLTPMPGPGGHAYTGGLDLVTVLAHCTTAQLKRNLAVAGTENRTYKKVHVYLLI